MPTLTIVIASSVRLMSETGKLKVHMNQHKHNLFILFQTYKLRDVSSMKPRHGYQCPTIQECFSRAHVIASDESLTYAGESVIVMGASTVYRWPDHWYQSCSNVVRPRYRPRVELAIRVAAEPSAGTVREYPSLRDSMASLASSVILRTVAPLVRETCKDGSDSACWIALLSEEPRPTTRRPSLSVFRCVLVRDTASERSEGASDTFTWMSKLGASFSAMVPVSRERGRGQRASTPPTGASASNATANLIASALKPRSSSQILTYMHSRRYATFSVSREDQRRAGYRDLEPGQLIPRATAPYQKYNQDTCSGTAKTYIWPAFGFSAWSMDQDWPPACQEAKLAQPDNGGYGNLGLQVRQLDGLCSVQTRSGEV